MKTLHGFCTQTGANRGLGAAEGTAATRWAGAGARELRRGGQPDKAAAPMGNGESGIGAWFKRG